MDASGHLWYRMALNLVGSLYNPSLGLFRESLGTSEGRCWYWSTEQGEAARLLVYLGDKSIIPSLLEGFRDHLAYVYGEHVHLFSRYTPCRLIRVLSSDHSNLSIGNLIVNVGGDLGGARSDIYSRVITLGLDIYKSPSEPGEEGKAWPSLWYAANMRGHEVWYLGPGRSSEYKGMWDTRDGSLGRGRIVSYGVEYDSSRAIAWRVMSDGILEYRQEFILETGSPYLRILLKVRNNSTSPFRDVRISLGFDNLDWWLYQVAYVPGRGKVNASTSGFDRGEVREYHIASSSNGTWTPLRDDNGSGW